MGWLDDQVLPSVSMSAWIFTINNDCPVSSVTGWAGRADVELLGSRHAPNFTQHYKANRLPDSAVALLLGYEVGYMLGGASSRALVSALA